MAVIGAGPAGLAAAWTLGHAGHEAVVYERRAVVGGLLRSAERAGVRADVAVQLLSSTYGETFRLAEDAGIADLLVPASGRDALWRNGRAHPITYGSATSMLSTGALPTMLKLKLGTKYVPWLNTRGARLDVNDLPSTGESEDRESIADWGARELGEDFVEYLAYPLLAAYYGTPPEEASAALYHALARVGMAVKVHALKGGAGAFAAALADAGRRLGVSVRTDAEVQSVRVIDGGVAVRSGAGEDVYGSVIVATPPDAAGALLEDESLRAWLAGVRTRPAVALTFWLGQRPRHDSFGISFPRVAPPGDVIVAACIQSRKLAFDPGVRGDAVVVFPSPAFLDRNPSDVELQQHAASALEQALPGIARVTEDIQVDRLEGGYRKFSPGTIRRLVHEPPPRVPGIHLAGDYLIAPTVEGAVRSGVRAAGRIERIERT